MKKLEINPINFVDDFMSQYQICIKVNCIEKIDLIF